MLRGVRASIVKPGNVEAGHDQPDTPLAEAIQARALEPSDGHTAADGIAVRRRPTRTTAARPVPAPG